MSDDVQIRETVRLLKKDIAGREIRSTCVSPTDSGVSLSAELEDGEKITLGSQFRNTPDNVVPRFYEELENQL